MKTDKTILITGAAGFIGSNLTKALLNDNINIIALDSLVHGSLDNIKEFKNNPNYKFINTDVRDKDILFEIAKNTGTIVHLAALKIPRYGGALNTLTVNVDGTRVVLDAAKQFKNKVFIASTSDVYGKNPELPFSEESSLMVGSPKIGRWSYAVSKMFDEQLFYAYREEYGIQGSIFRFFGSYGPNQELSWWGGPQSVFINAALKNEAIEIHGEGLQTRSFCYISDTIKGIKLVIANDKSDGEIFNIGNDYEITIKDLAILIWKLINGEKSTPKLKYIPYASFKRKYEDVKRRIPDLTFARKRLQYAPLISLEEGLLKTIEWQKQKLKTIS